MNKDLIMIDKNCSAVSDENGNIRIVKKENDKIDFLEILTTENEITNSIFNIEKLKKEISTIERKSEKIDLILMIPAVSVISMLILKLLPLMILLYIIIASNILLTPLYLQKSYYKNRKKTINEKITKITQKEEMLIKKLENMKSQTNYRNVNKSVEIKNLLEELNKNNYDQVETTLEKINTLEKENTLEVISVPSLHNNLPPYISKDDIHLKKLSLTNKKKL